MSIRSAFDMVLSLQSRSMNIERLGGSGPVAILAAPSNYFRNLNGLEDTVFDGREFVISKSSLDAVSFGVPKRNDRLIDTDLGEMTIVESREMYDIGGGIIGFRVKVE